MPNMGNSMTAKRVMVVGSGPSGIIAAKNFIDSGIAVDLYDVGITCSADNINFLTSKNNLLPKKTIFGSLFPYFRIDNFHFIHEKNVSFDTSHARGGLSNVWGATVGSPYYQDISNWPISFFELNSYVDKVFEIIGVTGSSDALNLLYSSRYRGPDLNYETNSTLDILNSAKVNHERLISHGIFVGKARLAIQAKSNEPNSCVLCNKCMNGCLSNSIFSASHILSKLLLSPHFKYHSHCLVEKFTEDKNGVSILFFDTKNNIKAVATADYLVLGAGCFDTTKIVNASKEAEGMSYQIKDSQKFYFPVITFKSSQNTKEQSIELAHIYVQMIDSQGHIIQTQLYPGSKILLELIKRLFGSRFTSIFNIVFRPLIKRFYIGMMYLHSDVSGVMSLKFTGDKVAHIAGIENKMSQKVFRNALWRMLVNARYLRFAPIPLFYLKAKLGHSQHFGSTLPMQEDNSKVGVNVNCRVNGFSRTFAVDSSVLPSIPGTPTTTLTMANSLRVSDLIIEEIKLNQ